MTKNIKVDCHTFAYWRIFACDENNYYFYDMEKGGAVYIMTNKHKTTLYVGVTSDLLRRVYEHKTHFYPRSFTHRYNLVYLVYYEIFSNIEEAIAMEKKLKAGNRKEKEALINKMNPQWKDLYDEILKW